MDDDWESADFVPPPPSIAREPRKSQWDDEDLADEHDKVKESWEEEEKPEPVINKNEAKKGKTKVTEVADLEEKLKQQKLDEPNHQEHSGKNNGDISLDNFIPKSESDFVEYGELVAQKIKQFEKSYYYNTFLKATIRHAMTALKASDAKEVSSSVSVIANEKLKAEKEATGKKKTVGSKKKQIHVGRIEEDAIITPYDDADDYDFM